jgi:hypothetical protein
VRRIIFIGQVNGMLYILEGNLASILEIDESGNKNFNIFSESPDNLKKDLG